MPRVWLCRSESHNPILEKGCGLNSNDDRAFETIFLAQYLTTETFENIVISRPLPLVVFLKSVHEPHWQFMAAFPQFPSAEQHGPFIKASAVGSHWAGLPSCSGNLGPHFPSSLKSGKLIVNLNLEGGMFSCGTVSRVLFL